MIPEMLLTDGGAAFLAMKNEQAPEIGIGKTEGMPGFGAPVRNVMAALRTFDRRVIGIAEIPIPQKFRKGLQRLGGRGIRRFLRAAAGPEQGLETFPQGQGDLDRNDVAALIREIVDLFLHVKLPEEARRVRTRRGSMSAGVECFKR